MIGIDPQRLIDENQLNLDMNKVFAFAAADPADPSFANFRPPAMPLQELAIYHQASDALRRLRQFWLDGGDQAEPRSMLLSQFDLDSQIAPDRSPFTLPKRNPVP